MKCCLVVDDSKVIRMVARKILEDLNFSIQEAEDGKQALDLLAQQSKAMVDLIITDVNMPNMDGVTFIKELKKMAQYTHTPVCVLTTETEQGKLEAEMQALKDAWITKPVQPAHVLNIVGELLAD